MMPYGRMLGSGRGGTRSMWRGGGWGFGFGGSSPPWPYVGLGRGGLLRCGHFLGGLAGVSPGTAAWGAPFYAPQMPMDQELDFLQGQSQAIKKELEQIRARISNLETKN